MCTQPIHSVLRNIFIMDLFLSTYLFIILFCVCPPMRASVCRYVHVSTAAVWLTIGVGSSETEATGACKTPNVCVGISSVRAAHARNC